MDLLLQSGKAGGIVGELLSPKGLLLLKLRVNVLKSLPSRRDGLARLGTKTEEHRPASFLITSPGILPKRGIDCTFWVGAPQEPGDAGSLLYRAVAGRNQTMGRTAGEALDALAMQLPREDADTLVIVRNMSPDRFFTAEQ